MFLCHTLACGILVPQPGIESGIPACSGNTESQHWTASEVPQVLLLLLFLRYILLLHLLRSGDFILPLNWTWAFVINPRTCRQLYLDSVLLIYLSVLGQHHTVLMTVTLWYVLKSHHVSTPTLFLFFEIYFGYYKVICI